MRADKVLSDIIARSGTTPSNVSRAMGKHRNYMSTVIKSQRIPQADTMATILDVLGYDLVARCRDDGYEYEIDPKQ